MAILRAVHDEGIDPPKILPLAVDFGDQKSVEAAAAKVADAFPAGIDIVVSNAGILEKGALLADADADTWWQSYEINIKGTFLICRSFIPQLQKKGNGLKIYRYRNIDRRAFGPSRNERIQQYQIILNPACRVHKPRVRTTGHRGFQHPSWRRRQLILRTIWTRACTCC
jgi:NAD(P)-dependent dehydrogenase (short-subunit alcohol dehydrogenase family)